MEIPGSIPQQKTCSTVEKRVNLRPGRAEDELWAYDLYLEHVKRYVSRHGRRRIPLRVAMHSLFAIRCRLSGSLARGRMLLAG